MKDNLLGKLTSYAGLKEIEKSTKASLETLGKEIKEELSKEDVDKVETDLGNFTLKKVPVYKYSPKVEELERAVDAQKTQEKADGTATTTIRTDLVYSASKKQDD